LRRLRISLRRIRWRDRRFSFSRTGPDERLAESIEEVGLLHPPDLWEEGRRFVVIAGARRLKALRRLGRRDTIAHVFTNREITPLEAWSMNFSETLSLRSLNPAEACTVTRQLTDLGVEEDKIISAYLPRLGLPPRQRTLYDCLSVAALAEAVLDALAGGSVPLTTAAFLATLETPDRRSAFRFLSTRPLTFSQQREWIRLLSDISLRDGITVRALISSSLRASSSHPGHRGPAALQILREKRYPTLTVRRRAFRALVKKLRLPPKFQVETHPFFERGELNFRFSVTDRSSLRRAVLRLEEIGRHPSFRRLVNPLEDEESSK
jgi:ParB family chromosome partitioning protein